MNDFAPNYENAGAVDSKKETKMMTNHIAFCRFCWAGRLRAVFALYALGLGLSASAQTITTFDVPGAASGNYQGTFGIGADEQGVIMGVYTGTDGFSHGFLRTPAGTITTFDAPGGVQGTDPQAINPLGTVTGNYTDARNVNHGFVRTPGGSFARFDAPGAGIGSGQGTFPININPASTVAGYYLDARFVAHAFLRTKDGIFTTYSVPGAGTATQGFPYQGTWTAYFSGLNPDGSITGFYLDESNVWHSYVRSPDGAVKKFNAPGAGTGAYQGTSAYGRDIAGATAGFYADTSNVNHGFLRASDGTFRTLDPPGVGTEAGQGTWINCMNLLGEVTGWYVDTDNVSHGFLATASSDYTFTTFDVEGAGTGASQGTLPLTADSVGEIVGYYLDSNSTVHGFLRSAGPPK